MDIGTKIRNARVSVKLTQEQAAEALGVSRQTISNWETQKTYPDIVSVIKMSDLYDISLDHLLKEEQPMSNQYLDYLEESTNTVKSKNKLAMVVLLALYVGIWAAALIVFWFLISGSDAMGYALLFLWGILPTTTFIVSLLIGKNNYWGIWKWLFVVIFGMMYMLSGYLTFSLANMISAHKINTPDYETILIGAFFSVVGMGIGSIIRRVKKWAKNRTKN